MAENKIKTKNLIPVAVEDYTTYYCPHCEEPFAVGVLVNVKVICSYCNKFFVIVGLAQEEDTWKKY